MRDNLDHLDSKYQRELGRIVQILREEFEREMATKLGEKQRAGRILKIILFGSFARGDWVEDRKSGYQSDYDILIIVNSERFTEVTDYWEFVFDRFFQNPDIRRPVNFIVHSLHFVNDALARAKYFFTDIYRDGVMLFEHKPSKRLKSPGILDRGVALEEAEEHYEYWMEYAKSFYRHYQLAFAKDANRMTAFQLHQAVESLYNGYLLVRTNYSPNSHNIEYLRSLCENYDPRFIPIFPRETQKARRPFNRLKDAYVKARYSKHYTIESEELTELGTQVEQLTKLIDQACQEWIKRLREGGKRG